MGEPPGWQQTSAPPGYPNGHHTGPLASTGRFVPATNVRSERARWLLWSETLRIPLAEITIAAGRGDVGKSLFTLSMAAMVTRGTCPGELWGRPGKVLILSREDSWIYTIKARLAMAGADMTMVGWMDVMVGGSPDELMELMLPAHLGELEELIVREGIALVIFDPLLSYLGKIKEVSQGEVRTELEKLAAVVHRTGTPFIGLAHFNKSTGVDSSDRISGSHAFRDVVRSVVVFGRDFDLTGICSQVKLNVGELPSRSTYYTLSSSPMVLDDGSEVMVPWFAWGAQTDEHVDDLLAAREKPAVKSAWLALRGLFQSHGAGHWIESDYVEGLLKGDGHAPATIDRTRAKMKRRGQLVTAKFGDTWYMQIPRNSNPH